MGPLLWFVTFVALTLASDDEDDVYQSTLRVLQYPNSLISEDNRTSFAAEYWPYYTLNISMGRPHQDLEVLVDTDRGETLVYDEECNECKTQSDVKLYQYNDSKASYKHRPGTFKLEHTNYYDNEGIISNDDIAYGDGKKRRNPSHQPFFRAKKYMPRYPGVSGYFGLAMQSYIGDYMYPVVDTDAYEQYFNKPIFTMFITKNPENGLPGKGLITYGAVDAVNCDDKIHYAPLTGEKRWEINVTTVMFRNYAYEGVLTAAVTSQDVMILPQAIYDGIVGQIELKCESNGMVECVVPHETESSRARRLDQQSETDNPQALTFVLSDGYELKVKNIIYKHDSQYYLSVLPRKSAAFTNSDIEFGHTLLFEWCTIHDMSYTLDSTETKIETGTFQIGFARHKTPVESELDKCTLPSK